MMSTRSLHIGPAIGPAIGARSDGAAPETTTLTVTIADSQDPVISAVDFTYAVVVTNTGALEATSVSAVIALDPSLTFVSGSGTGWTVGAVGQTVTCTRAALAVGAAPTITITVTTADAASTEVTTADVTAANAYPPATQDIETTVVKLVARDATSLKRMPATLTQWTDFNAYHVAIGTVDFPDVLPSSLYLFQEASGNIVDAIGGITLTATGASLLYQQAVTGWSALEFRTPDGLASHNAQNTTTAVDISATSALWMLYIRMPAATPAATRRFGRINATGILSTITATPVLQCVTGGAGGSTVGGASNPTAAVRPLVIQVDRANTRAMVLTDQETITGTAGTYATIALGVGSSGGNSADAGYIYGPLFTGAAAEISVAGTKSLLRAMNWTIA